MVTTGGDTVVGDEDVDGEAVGVDEVGGSWVLLVGTTVVLAGDGDEVEGGFTEGDRVDGAADVGAAVVGGLTVVVSGNVVGGLTVVVGGGS